MSSIVTDSVFRESVNGKEGFNTFFMIKFDVKEWLYDWRPIRYVSNDCVLFLYV